jgi:hypothetical protein
LHYRFYQLVNSNNQFHIASQDLLNGTHSNLLFFRRNMMKTIIAATLLVGSFSAYAETVTADTNLAIGARTILGVFPRVTEVSPSEKPNVDKSLAIGANSILGVFPRVTQVDPANTPNVDQSRDSFVNGVMNRNAGYKSRTISREAALGNASTTN